jgi:hypothetical protein
MTRKANRYHLIRIAALTALLLAAHCAFPQLATGVNYNAATPAAPTGTRNVIWQNDGGRPTVNASAFVTFPTIQVACPASGDLSVPVSNAFAAISATYGGIVDARACTAATTWTTALTITKANTVLLLPCITLSTTQTFTVPASTRNTVLKGCGYQGGSTASGTAGATVWIYTGNGNAFSIGDPTYAADTPGFAAENLNINTASAGSAAQALHFYRTQEIRLDNLYLNGNGTNGQTAVTLDGTGNYSGGTFIGLHIAQYGTAWLLTGHLSGSVVDDYANASTFVKIHVDCPTSSNLPIAGTYGFNVAGGDGNTWTGGDVEGCATMFHLGPAATANTIVGLRNENSTMQYVADSGSSYNSVVTGGTLFTGQLSDAGSRNSFSDAFHRAANGITGDWYASQVDATLSGTARYGIGLGNERGYLTKIQTDYGYRWTIGFSDAAAGEQFYYLTDTLNSVNRLSIGQYNHAYGSTNNQTGISSAGTGAVIFNGSANAGTGGVAFGSGGASPTNVATIDSSGDGTLYGYLRFFASAAEQWRFNCSSSSACNVDDWSTGSAVHRLRLYSGSGTEIDSAGTAAVTFNNTNGSGTGGAIFYKGGANYATAAFTIDSSGNTSQLSNHQTGSASGTGNEVIGNHLNQIATADFAGTCAMASAVSCTVALQHSYGTGAVCFCSLQGNLTYYASCGVASNNLTCTANASNTATWAAFAIGNPN